MKLVGNKLDRFNRGYIQALIFKPELDIERPIDLLIDTGAANTIISMFDAKNLGISINKLKKSAIPVKGVGGHETPARHLGECQLVFRLGSTWLIENLEDILVLEDNENTEDAEDSPSVLGMDVLRYYNVDCSGQQFILER